MAKTGGQASELRNKNRIPDNVPLFTLQGNFDVNRLHGVYRIMMGIMLKTLGKALKQKTDRTEEENDMLDMMVCGDKRVNSENLGSAGMARRIRKEINNVTGKNISALIRRADRVFEERGNRSQY